MHRADSQEKKKKQTTQDTDNGFIIIMYIRPTTKPLYRPRIAIESKITLKQQQKDGIVNMNEWIYNNVKMIFHRSFGWHIKDYHTHTLRQMIEMIVFVSRT